MQHFTHRIAFYVAVGDKKKYKNADRKLCGVPFFFSFFFFTCKPSVLDRDFQSMMAKVEVEVSVPGVKLQLRG